MSICNRVVVVHIEAGEAGLVGDTILVSFVATPSGASTPSEEPEFSDQKGIWTARWIIDPTPGSDLAYRLVNIRPVIQVGDVITASDGDRTITDLAVYDQLAKADATTVGGDHRVAFWASTDKGDLVLRATQQGVVSP